MSISLDFDSYIRLPQPLWLAPNDWYLNKDKGNCTGLIFIDLKEAFDTVDHEILLKKLKMCGVTGPEHDFFISYLDNRKQFCSIDGTAHHRM